MPRVLVVGYDPEAVPGIDGPAMRSALDAELERFAGEGIEGSMVLVTADPSTVPTFVDALASRPWDVVVVGGGIRKAEPLLTLFELVVNLVREHAPEAALAFNTSGGDSVEAARRWLS
ncbi:hypothetical protein [Luteimicrobium sp. DT211]|uniref:hypothetical protein n=1 Tax=Luteimicrobium sp. DT211 TaxID=3393412 RepID=UPI003CF4D4DA